MTRRPPTRSELDLRPHLHDAVRGNLEELGRRARVARHHDEQFFAPARHRWKDGVVWRSSRSRLSLAPGGNDDSLTTEIKGRVVRFGFEAGLTRPLEDF